MGVTVNINGLSLCHRGSNGITVATAPDVCNTPPVPTPIPYPNIAFSSDLSGGTTTVFADGGNSAAIQSSIFSKSTGDEPGTGGGVVSGTFTKDASWLTFSADVFFEGESVCRLTDKMLHNHGNTVNCSGEMQAPLAAAGGGALGGPDPCADLLQKIKDLIDAQRTSPGSGPKGLKSRFEEQIHGSNGPGTPEWQGHEMAIKEQQQALRKRLKKWDDNNCGPPPDGATEWADKPVPTAADWKDPGALSRTLAEIAEWAAGLGAAYLAYRAIRMLPSLIPPLWPTIPANVAVP